MSSERYFHTDGSIASDPISKERPRKLRYFTGKTVPAKVSTWDGTMTRG